MGAQNTAKPDPTDEDYVNHYVPGWPAGRRPLGSVDVRDFGARCDGVTDDTAALRNALASGAREVCIASGTCPTSAGLTVPTGVTLWLGSGATLKPSGGGYNPLTVHGSLVGVPFADSTIDMAGVPSWTGVLVGDGALVSGITIVNLQTGAGIGNMLNAATGNNAAARIEKCSITRSAVTPTLAAITMYAFSADVTGVELVGNYVDCSAADKTAAVQGVSLYTVAPHVNWDALVALNRIKLPVGATLTSCIGVMYRRAHRIRVIGNLVHDGQMGISNDTTDGATITGNECLGNIFTGIENPGSRWGTITGNVVDGQGVCGNGIIIDGTSPCDGTVVVGNTIRGGKGGAATGINVSESAPGAYVAGNWIEASTYPTALNVTAVNLPQVFIGRNPGFAPPALAAPAVPVSTVALANPFPYDCTVYVTGGAVTVIAVKGVATGLTSGAVRVPAGATITLTYTAPPTWAWVGD